ncbi:hypothetical protein HDU96_007714 [Phlyctochytrium bullatum]|nr:hypothetical protein HDU96_007714 [Phlyctochytrium bullatum]
MNQARGYTRLEDDDKPKGPTLGRPTPTPTKPITLPVYTAATAAAAAASTTTQPLVPHPRGDSRVPPGKLGQQRRVCCCFRTVGGCCATFCIIIVLLLVGLGVLGYFAFPRKPDVVVSDPYVPVGTAGFRETGAFDKASKSAPYILSFQLALNVSVNSPNYFSLKVDEINIKGNLVDDQGKKIERVGANGQTTNVNFKAFENTTFVLPLALNYTTTDTSDLLNDKVLSMILDSCGILPNAKKRDLTLDYEVSLKIPLISFTGYVPSFTGRKNFACPSSAAKSVSKVLTEKLIEGLLGNSAPAAHFAAGVAVDGLPPFLPFPLDDAPPAIDDADALAETNDAGPARDMAYDDIVLRYLLVGDRGAAAAAAAADAAAPRRSGSSRAAAATAHERDGVAGAGPGAEDVVSDLANRIRSPPMANGGKVNVGGGGGAWV